MSAFINKVFTAICRRIDYLIYALTNEPSLLWKNIALRKTRRRHGLDNHNEKAQQILSEGFIKMEVDPKDIAFFKRMDERFNKVIIKKQFIEQPDPQRPNSKYFGKYLFNFIGNWKIFFPEIRYIIENNAGDILRSYFGKEYNLFGVSIAKKKYVPPELADRDVFSNYWHFDFRRSDTSWLLVVMHLNEHTEAEAFQTFDLKTSLGAVERKQFGRFLNSELPEELKDSPVIKTGGPAGTCYIVNVADLLHRGGDPGPDKDRDVIFAFVGADVPWPANKGFKAPPQPLKTGF